MTIEPNGATVANAAAFLAAMPLPEAKAAFQAILTAIRRDMPAQMGWSAKETEAFVCLFADRLADELNAMPLNRVVH